jgi:hypothetical protein
MSTAIDNLLRSYVLVAAVVGDSAANNRKLGRILEAKYPWLLFVNCAAHSLQLIVQRFMKIEPFKTAFVEGKRAAKILKKKKDWVHSKSDCTVTLGNSFLHMLERPTEGSNSSR